MILLLDLDNVLYKLLITISLWALTLVKGILNLIFDLANISFFSDNIISSILKRVYIIIGVLMLFKITISCIQYLVNPDKAEDKENGFGGIIKRTVISISLLILVPTIFNFAKSSQNAILEALPKVILGQETSSNVDDISENLAYTTAVSFLNYSSESCNDGSIGMRVGAKSNPEFSSISDLRDNVDTIANATCQDEKRYTFNFLCLPAGAFLIFTLVSMVIDVGIRVIKFGFLEIIAPIPIASYIDPKTSKKSFDSWVHNSVSVYIDLFIRLGVIYLVLYLFVKLLPIFSSKYVLNDGTKISWERSMLVNVAIIISLFFFAKNAPKFICDVLGIKDDGNIGDMFKRAGGLAGSGLAGLRAAKSNYITQKERLQGKGKGKVASSLRAALSAAAGAGSATARGMKMATWDKKGFNDVRKGASKAAVAKRDARIDRADNLYTKDYNWRDYLKDKRRADLGIPSGSAFLEARNKEATEIRASNDKMVKHFTGKLEDNKGRNFISSDSTKGFGTVTDGDGNKVVITESTLARARAMATLNVGDYYDDGKITQRQDERKRKNDKLINSKNEFERLSNLKASGAIVSDTDLNNAKVEYEKAQFDFNSYEKQFFNDGQNGRAVATEDTKAEWDVLVRSLEKQARFQLGSDLIRNNDVDSIVELQKAISKLTANISIGRGNSETDEQITEFIRTTMNMKDKNGEEIKTIEQIRDLLNTKDSDGKYAVDAMTLEKYKLVTEGLERITNEEALVAAERAKRTQQAIQNDKKSGS